MENKRKKIWMGIFLMGILCLSGCGNSYNKSESYEETTSYYSSDDGEMDGYGLQSPNVAEATEAEYAEEVAEGGATEEAISGNGDLSDSVDELSRKSAMDNKKIIKTYHYAYDTENFDESYQYLRQEIDKYDGYISSSELYGTKSRSLSLTARIPADKCDSFVEQLGSLGTVVSQSESAEDVTLQYTDTESHIKSLETEQKRLNELLAKADDLDGIITLEQRLTQVRSELENYKSRKMLYDDLITYCTVNITLEEVIYTVPVDDSSIFSRIKTGLQTTFRDIIYDLGNFFVWFVVSLPYFIIWIVIIFVIYRIIRRLVRRGKAKRLAKKQAKEALQAAAQETGAGVTAGETSVEKEVAEDSQTTDRK